MQGELVMCQKKLVQEAVDTLLDSGIRGQPIRDGHKIFQHENLNIEDLKRL